MAPKGKLLVIGGAEDRSENDKLEMREKNNQFERFEILKELLPPGDYESRIEVITSASLHHKEMKKMYEDTFKEIGYKNIGFMNIENKMQARDETFCQRVADAKAVFFTGGDQLRLSTIIGGTEMAGMLLEKYINDKDFTAAGTSAGAMAMTKIMICGGGVSEALLGSDLHTASGFGLLDNCIRIL